MATDTSVSDKRGTTRYNHCIYQHSARSVVKWVILSYTYTVYYNYLKYRNMETIRKKQLGDIEIKSEE